MLMFSLLNPTGEWFLRIGDRGIIKWYAICILLGIFVAYFISVKEAKKQGVSGSLITDGILIIVPIAIIGARLYYVLFDADKSRYTSIVDIIAVWDGGLAIIGAVIATAIAAIIYCRVRKMNTLATFDLIAPGLLVGQILGRWGNWFNGEAHGGVIQSEGLVNFFNKIMPWVMRKMNSAYCNNSSNRVGSVDFELTDTYYHPTFLYESLWNLLGLIIILVVRRKSKKVQVGDFIFFYLFWYGLGRSTLIEPYRTDQLMPVFGVPVNILLPAIMAVIGLIVLILKHTVKKLKQEPYCALIERAKTNRIETVYCRLEGSVVNMNSLVKNAYYDTFFKLDCKKLNDIELNQKMKEGYLKALNGDVKKIAYFNDYLINNRSQIQSFGPSCKAFFKSLFVSNYQVAIYSEYDTKIIACILEQLGLDKYISVYLENVKNASNILDTFAYNNCLVISSRKSELRALNKNNVYTCLTDQNSKNIEDIQNIDYVAKNYDMIGRFIVL